MRHDLGEGRLVALPLGLHTEAQLGLAGRVDPQLATVGHAQSEDVHVLAGTRADSLGEERQANAHQRCGRVGARFGRLGSAFRLLPPEFVVAGDAHGLFQRPGIVSRVVLPPGRGHVRELLRSEQVFHPQLGRILFQVEGQAVDHAFHEIDRFGYPKRARVGHATERLVGVHRGDLAVGRRVVVGAGEDVEEPGRELRRLGHPVERPVVGQDVHPQGQDLAVLGRRDLPVHVVVPGERGGHQVLGSVLYPFHRDTGHD